MSIPTSSIEFQTNLTRKLHQEPIKACFVWINVSFACTFDILCKDDLSRNFVAIFNLLCADLFSIYFYHRFVLYLFSLNFKNRNTRKKGLNVPSKLKLKWNILIAPAFLLLVGLFTIISQPNLLKLVCYLCVVVVSCIVFDFFVFLLNLTLVQFHCI